jgi:hypothetical protein
MMMVAELADVLLIALAVALDAVFLEVLGDSPALMRWCANSRRL